MEEVAALVERPHQASSEDIVLIDECLGRRSVPLSMTKHRTLQREASRDGQTLLLPSAFPHHAQAGPAASAAPQLFDKTVPDCIPWLVPV